jgi:hypothetical protein
VKLVARRGVGFAVFWGADRSEPVDSPEHWRVLGGPVGRVLAFLLAVGLAPPCLLVDFLRRRGLAR